MPSAPSTLDPRAILGLLAHRYPFLLVDRIEIVERGRRVVGHKQVTAGEWAAGGPTLGAPQAPVGVPGLLVVEALAQTSAALLVDLLEAVPGAVGYFVAMERVRLRRMPVPGDTLRLTVELRSFRRGIARLRGRADLDGRTAVTADFTTVVRPAPAPSAR